MKLIWVIREICSVEGGFKALFDKSKAHRVLTELSDDKQEVERFSALLYGSARTSLIELVHDAYNYKDYVSKICGDLRNGGMSEEDARRTLEIFFKAFGFPGYRDVDSKRVGAVINDKGDFKIEYQGEIRNGKEHGIGIRTCYFEGNWCNYDESVWVDGVMCGYDDSKEVEFGMFENRTVGFVVEDHFIGKSRVFTGDEEYTDVGERLDI
ncbi:MAG: hypothetical protein IKA62_08370 [Clostridia bacterium]|nr:hypothetical protein [Clostridia bacterium]